MTRALMSRAAAGLLHAILARANVPRERVLLTDVGSVDWCSLTFVGERHEMSLRITGVLAGAAGDRLCEGLADADFTIPGQFVADIAMTAGPILAADGTVSLSLEALTIVA